MSVQEYIDVNSPLVAFLYCNDTTADNASVVLLLSNHATSYELNDSIQTSVKEYRIIADDQLYTALHGEIFNNGALKIHLTRSKLEITAGIGSSMSGGISDAIYIDGAGTPTSGIAVMGTDGTNPQILSCNTDGELKVNLETADIEIGAVEIKNATTDDRVIVKLGNTFAAADMALGVSDPNAAALLTTIDADTGAILADTAAIEISNAAILVDTSAISVDTGTIQISTTAIEADTGTLVTSNAAILVDTTAILADTAAIDTATATLALSEAALTPTHTAPVIGAGSTAALGSNAARVSALFQNISDEAIYLNIGAAAADSTGIKLQPEASFSMSAKEGTLSTLAVNAISASGTKILLVTEFV